MSSAPPPGPGLAAGPGRERVAGWDLLRGLCAFAVMTYHLLGWQDLAHVSPLGTYGVYLFFLLSGASLAYVYDADRVGHWAGIARFLAVRWLRLAPLYLVVCLIFVGYLSIRQGRWVDELPLRLALNASFAFGAYDPTTWALAVGGWSLGVEFMFYLAFPLLMQAARSRLGAGLALLALAVLQATWVERTVGREGLEATMTAYHQVPAFAAYFFAGCWIGQVRRERPQARPCPMVWALGSWAALGLLLVACNGTRAGDELVGWRGVLLPVACAAVVWVSGQVQVRGWLLQAAAALGRWTYGVYLIHPLVYFGWAWFVWPGSQAAVAATPALGWVLALTAAVLTTVLAAWGYRWIEAPGQRLAARWFKPALR